MLYDSVLQWILKLHTRLVSAIYRRGFHEFMLQICSKFTNFYQGEIRPLEAK